MDNIRIARELVDIAKDIGGVKTAGMFDTVKEEGSPQLIVNIVKTDKM